MNIFEIDTFNLVLFSCLVTAISRITLKKGLETSNAITGMVFSLLFGWITLSILLLFNLKNQQWSLTGVLFFSFIGVIAPPVVRFLTYLGVEKLGPSRSDPIRSMTPIFAIFFAITLFKESINYYFIVACLLIILGSYFISRDGSMQNEPRKLFHTPDLLYPLLAAIIAGIIANLRKLGMNYNISSMAAAWTAASTAVIIFGLFSLSSQRYKKISLSGTSTKYFVFTGVLVSFTDIVDLIALKKSNVSFVSPLQAATPLFIIVLSTLFLRKIEKITLNLVSGALLIFSGVLLVNYFK